MLPTHSGFSAKTLAISKAWKAGWVNQEAGGVDADSIGTVGSKRASSCFRKGKSLSKVESGRPREEGEDGGVLKQRELTRRLDKAVKNGFMLWQGEIFGVSRSCVVTSEMEKRRSRRRLFHTTAAFQFHASATILKHRIHLLPPAKFGLAGDS